MVGNSIATLYGKANNGPMGAALSIAMMLAITLVVCAFLALIGPKRLLHKAADMHSKTISRLLTGFALAYLAFLYIPVLLLPLFSFNDNIYITFPLKGFTLKWYQAMVAAQPLIDSLVASVQVGLAVSVVSTVIGMLAAMGLTRYQFPGKGLITSTIMLPLVIPYIILAFRSSRWRARCSTSTSRSGQSLRRMCWSACRCRCWC